MASAYGILTVSGLNGLVNYNIKTTAANGTTRLYSDDFLETAIISMNERLVFGDLKVTYTSDTIPVDVKFAIDKLCKIDMERQLYDDRKIDKEPPYDAITYWKEILYPMLMATRTEKAYVDGEVIDDYELTT